MVKTTHLNGLTSIRFFLAMWVVSFHSCEEFRNISFIFQIINKGYAAVGGFFLLSGLILAYNYDKKFNLVDYFQNRFARIYPLYFLSLLIAFPLFAYFQYKTQTNYLSTIAEVSLSSVFMLQSWNTSWLLHLNAPTWSLSVEAFLYLLFPLSIVLLRRINKTSLIVFQILCFCFILFLLARVLSLFANFYYNFNLTFPSETIPIAYITLFLIGIATGLLLKRNILVFIRLKSYKVAMASIIVVAMILVLLLNTNLFNGYSLNFGILSPFYLIIFIILSNNNDLLSSKILLRLGKISYAIYLLHLPVKAYLLHIFNFIQLNNNYICFAIYIVILLTISNFVYLKIELPAYNKLKTMRFLRALVH